MRKVVLIILVIGFSSFSCTKLDLEPLTGEIETVVFDNFEGYQSYFAKIYGALVMHGNEGPHGDPDLPSLGDEGNSSYLRMYWALQEQTTGNVVQSWNVSQANDLHKNQWSSDNDRILIYYVTGYYLISMANDFLTLSEELPGHFSSEEVATIGDYRNEVRFLRALVYTQMLDLFRNIPVTTVISNELPVQYTPQETFNFIESELNAIEPDMKAPGENQYGRADQGAVWALQAKLYLNAQVYTGEDKNAECIAACNKIINSGNYSLSANYKELFMADNHLRREEIIFSIPQDAEVTQSWGGTTELVAGTVGGAMHDNLDENGNPFPDEALVVYGIDAGWSGYRCTSELADKFPAYDGSIDKRAIFFTEGQTLKIEDLTIFTQGFPVPKFKNIEAATGERPPTGSVKHASVDFPMYRLADIYLMAAEAELRSSGTISSNTLDLLNQIRYRAYGDHSGDITTGEVTLDWLLDERQRELYWECHRRTDLVRFGKFTSGDYLWPWKGGVKEGTTVEEYRNIFPLPSREILVNPNLTQNTGY